MDVSAFLRSPAALPLRAAEFGIKVAAGVAEVSADLAAATAGAARTAGIELVTAPVRQTLSVPAAVHRAVQIAIENVGGAEVRRCYCAPDRAWIEVRGLRDTTGSELGDAVLAAVRAYSGITAAHLNYPLSRVFVRFDATAPTCEQLCESIQAAEERAAASTSRSPNLPGDQGMFANQLVSAGITAAGMWGAAVGRTLRLPRLPLVVGASVSAANYQPALRRLMDDQLGKASADQVLSVATFVSRTFGQVPGSLAVGFISRVARAAECRAGQRAWERYEPLLAQYADCADVCPLLEPTEARGDVERHVDRSALAQAVASAAAGLVTGDSDVAARAALVAVPKAAYSTRELFASTLARGLADDAAALPLQPDVWRKLDRVDAVVIDPRAMCTTELRVGDVRGVADHARAAVWEDADARLEAGELRPGWQRLDGRWDGADVLIGYELDPMAPPIVAEARGAGAEVVALDDDSLGDLRSAFDDVRSADGASMDAALAGAVMSLHDSGKTVALVSTAAAQACASADVAIGVIGDECPIPWYADVLVDDLSTVWRILHALPAARTASRRGVEIATGASALGALLMVPGVRGRGPGPVTTGAAAGQWAGYRLARRALSATPPAAAPTQDWHAISAEQVRRLLPPPSDVGLQRAGHLAPVTRVVGDVKRNVSGFAGAIRAELSDPLTPVLATGSMASGVLGSPIDAVLVGSVLLGNAALAATQRIHAERVLNTLLAREVPEARKVVVDQQGCTGDYVTIPADRLRPGDLIEVRPDEVVPADGRVIEAADVEVDESSLTGESLPVGKLADATPGAPLAERACMLFAGSTVVAGTVVAVVTAVGGQTQANRAAELAGSQPQCVGLQTQLRKLTDRVWRVSMIGGGLVTTLGLLRGIRVRDAVSSGVAVSVSAVPEGLPLVATLAQQASARRLTRTGALVRSPHSVEALGRVDVVCFDKTGTLSQNRLRVAQVRPAAEMSDRDVVACAAEALPPSNGAPHQHATDAAIAEAAGAAEDKPEAHLPFRSGRPYSASLFGTTVSVKGAPEVLLPASDCGAGTQRMVHEMAADGLRVIAVGSADVTSEQARAARANPDLLADYCQGGLRLAGLLGIADTPRAEAPKLLSGLHDRGVGVRLITGDHPVTAAAMASELGLPVTREQVITGSEWDGLSRRAQEEAVSNRLVFARMSPEQKVQIVQRLERIGRVCAMVGDGVNDAAAIRAATVGIGVAARGSAPARTAADVMLLDGRIESLLDGLDEGRQLWQRVRAAVAVLLGGNAGEVLFAIIGSAFTGRAPLNARQLLLVNMLTDALPAAALAVSPPSNGTETDGRGMDEVALWRAVGVRGAATAVAATAAWTLAGMTGRRRRAATVALVALVSAQLGQTLLDSHGRLVVSTALGSLAAMGVLISTPGVSQLLGCTPLGPIGWAQALGTAAAATGVAALAPKLLPEIAVSAAEVEAALDDDARGAPSRARTYDLRIKSP
jgi:cation-transporting ATPase I